LRSIVRLRWPTFIFVILLITAAYNGRWRVGRDSALYREVARNLATEKGYTFRSQHERHIYPGLPLLLAGIDKVFGIQDPLQPRVAQAVMLFLGLLTLVVIYYLVLAYYPPWLAVCVTTGVGINMQFLEQTHELLTDLPFLLGVCTNFLGLAKISQRTSRKSIVIGIILATLGAGVAVTMRPTFWALVFAWCGACVIGVFRSRQRWWYAAGIGATVLILLMWWKFDPRIAGKAFLSGKYETVVLNHLQKLDKVDWSQRLNRTFEKHLPESLIGFELVQPMGLMLGIVYIGGAFVLMRKSAVWGLYVLVTIAMTVVIGSVPRYLSSGDCSCSGSRGVPPAGSTAPRS
jgi:hypothetical protein